MPVVAIVRELGRRGIDTLVDGAHAPGMIPCDVRSINAAYWTGNGHKWLCGPKGSGLLHVRADLRAQVRPLATSHGANSLRTDRSGFRLAFDWQGTLDPSPWLTLPAAIRFVGGLHEDGWAGLMAANRTMARDARDRLCTALGIPAPAPDAMLGAMAAIPVAGIAATEEATAALQHALLEEDGIEVPVFPFPVPAAREAGGPGERTILRLSAQRYNRSDEYVWLAERVAARVKAARSPRSMLGRLRRS
jgi:isopenicillin-N epimerase